MVVPLAPVDAGPRPIRRVRRSDAHTVYARGSCARAGAVPAAAAAPAAAGAAVSNWPFRVVMSFVPADRMIAARAHAPLVYQLNLTDERTRFVP